MSLKAFIRSVVQGINCIYYITVPSRMHIHLTHTLKITLDYFFNWGRLGLNVNWLRSHAVSYQSTRTNHIMKSCLGSNESSSAFCQVSVLSYEVFLYRGFLFLGGYVHAAATGRR